MKTAVAVKLTDGDIADHFLEVADLFLYEFSRSAVGTRNPFLLQEDAWVKVSQICDDSYMKYINYGLCMRTVIHIIDY